MSRPRNNSTIQIPPRVRGFIPVGYYADESEPLYLNIEEFEAIRLLDYEDQDQINAAKIMGISRPTLTRIYERARKKIAKALTESHQILIEGGKAIFNGEWQLCLSCNCRFNNPLKTTINNCPLCTSDKIKKIINK